MSLPALWMIVFGWGKIGATPTESRALPCDPELCRMTQQAIAVRQRAELLLANCSESKPQSTRQA